MDTKIKESIEKNVQLIVDAANATAEVNEGLGSVIIRAADLPTSGSVLGAARKTLPDIANQLMFAVNQIRQAIKDEKEPEKEKPENAQHDQPAPDKKKKA